MDPRIATSLDELGTEDRAIVELAEVRGIGDAEIAGYLGVDAHEAKRRRRAALGRLADRLGVSREEARAALASALPPGETNRARRRNGRAGRPVDHVADRARAARRRSRQTVEGGGRTRCAPAHRLPWRPRRRSPGPPSAGAHATWPRWRSCSGCWPRASPGQSSRRKRDRIHNHGGPPGWRQAVPKPHRWRSSSRWRARPGGRGQAGRRWPADGDRRRPPDPGEGRYAAGRYGSLTRTRLLGSAADGDFEVQAALPRERSGYRLIDVSLEPVDRVRGHSGQSLLRVPLADLQPEG